MSIFALIYGGWMLQIAGCIAFDIARHGLHRKRPT